MFTAILAVIQLTQKLEAVIHFLAVSACFPRGIYCRGFLSCNFGIYLDPKQMLAVLEHRGDAEHQHKRRHPEFALVACFAEDLVQAIEGSVVLLGLHLSEEVFELAVCKEWGCPGRVEVRIVV